MSCPDARLAAANHHPLYPPPAFLDETHLREVELTRAEAEEDIERMQAEGKEVPAAMAELIYREIPSLISEVRHQNRLLGRER